MRESSKRQVTHPWLMARDGVNANLPPGAEPSFGPETGFPVEIAEPAVRSTVPEPSLSSLFGGSRPEVVVKRKRSFKTPSPETLAEDADSSTEEAERAPKVFRVAQGVVAQGAADLDDDVPPGPTPPSQTVPPRRRRRKVAPAVVVVFSKSAEKGAEPGETGMADPQGAAKALAMLRQLDEVLEDIGRAQSFQPIQPFQPAPKTGMPTPGAESQYQSLLAEIRSLQEQAERARVAEKSHAIAWIKKAIAEHKLTAEDFGL